MYHSLFLLVCFAGVVQVKSQLSVYNVGNRLIGPAYHLVQSNEEHIKPRWLIIAGRKVIPGEISRVAIQILKKDVRTEDQPVQVKVSLLYNDQQIAVAQTTVQPGDLSNVLLKVPEDSNYGRWQLKVEGFEGALKTFTNHTNLIFTPEFLTILIQSSRPIYNAQQRVHFRAILLTKDFTPYEKPIDVFVLDPMGRIMRRWPSRQPADGVVGLHFDLPEFPLLGDWTIQIKAKLQVQNQIINVQQYYKQRFEVFVRLPQTFNLGEDFIKGSIVANMTNGRQVYGNCSMKLQLAKNDDKPIPTDFLDIFEYHIANFTGVQDFSFPMSLLLEEEHGAEILNGKIIRIVAKVGDAYGWRIQSGWALARLHTDKIKLRFLGDEPFFYQPGMPITLHAAVSYEDDHPLEIEEMENGTLFFTVWASETSTSEVVGSHLVESGGVVSIKTTIPEETENLEVTAKFTSSSGHVTTAAITGLPSFSTNRRHIVVETSTEQVSPGEFIVLHVRNNFYVSKINYVVLSEGLLVYNGQEPVFDLSYPTVTTFSLPASAQMAPLARVLVWVVDQHGEVIAHSLAVPVNPLTRHQVEVEWNYHKDHSGNSIEVHMTGEVGAYFATRSVWEEIHYMSSGHDLSEPGILHQMMKYSETVENNFNITMPHVRHASFRHRDGSESSLLFYPTPSVGADTASTFGFSDAVIATDAHLALHPALSTDAGQCLNDTEINCLRGGCFKIESKCDGFKDCPDGSDEFGCPQNLDPYRDFRLNRISAISFLYNMNDGDWAWSEIRGEGEQFLVFDIPKPPQAWVFTVFAVGKETGLGIFNPTIEICCIRPFHLQIDAPEIARMGEQVGLTVGVFNFHSATVGVLLTLQRSEEYQVVIVEPNGIVDSYKPRKLEGTFQHVVWLEAGASRDVHIPIVFNSQGSIEVTVEGATQMNRASHTVEIEIVPEGVSIGQHTSVLLDLKNRAVVYQFMDLHLDESPIIPYTLDRRYIFGTPAGQISISGDVIGPLFPEIPVNTDNMVGFDVIGAEASAYNFAANLWSLHYLRLTNQLDDRIRFDVLTAINVDYASLARYQNEDGSFSNWIDSEASVWLTAHALNSLSTVGYQDWENYIFVDPSILQKGAEWLLQFQTPIGSFTETPSYINPLDPKVDPRSWSFSGSPYRNISLTAKVLLTLTTISPVLEGILQFEAILAKQRAMRYLEALLPDITDPYELSVVTWALTVAESPEKELAFSLLDSTKRTKGDMVYWSREDVIIDPLIFEDSQRAYLQPKEDNQWDSLTSEATSYALLVYVAREGVGILQENIVRFLASMRAADGGILSTLDSLVALEALVKYSYRARLREVTDMSITIEQSAAPDDAICINLKNEPGLATMRSHELNKLWGHISITGRGSGQAIVQLDYSYGVDALQELDQPVVSAFELDVSARYYGRNNSQITITSCQRWINTDDSPTSGLAVVEIHLPSGYSVVLQELLDIVNSGSVPNLRWARRTNADIKFFFQKLTEDPVCFSYTIDRWYPVSNHSRFNLAQVYELYQPERFEMKRFEVFPLYSLDICEVCGSFQCPYCPFYNGARTTSINIYDTLPLTIIVIYYMIVYRLYL